MAHIEYERRFLVREISDVVGFERGDHELIVQGYLAQKAGAALRIRRRMGMLGFPGNLSFKAVPVLELKGPRVGAARSEQPWEVDEVSANSLMQLSAGIVSKRRYSLITVAGLGEIDEFLGENEGLLIAEFESMEPMPGFVKPVWCKDEVTNLRRFDNEQLAVHPISKWSSDERRQFGLGHLN